MLDGPMARGGGASSLDPRGCAEAARLWRAVAVEMADAGQMPGMAELPGRVGALTAAFAALRTSERDASVAVAGYAARMARELETVSASVVTADRFVTGVG